MTTLLALVAVLVAACGEDDAGEPADSTPAPAAVAGCDQGVGELRVDPGTAPPGETIAIEVENLSEDQVLTYGLGSGLEREEDGRWATLELPPTPVPQIALIVRPGETSAGGGGATSDRLELPADLEPGSYRVVKEVTAGDPAGGGQTEALTLCAALTVAS